MIEDELVSVIVPVYNTETYLLHCLETIAKQSYHNLEIIIVDDGSTDRSGDICDNFAKKDSRAIVIHNKKLGLCTTRNTGLQMMRGKYVTFVDSDDFVHQDYIKVLHDAINRNEGFDIAIAGFKKTYNRNDEEVLIGNGKTLVYSQEDLLSSFFCHHYPNLNYAIWNKMYRKESIKGIYFNNYSVAEDLDFNFRVYQKAKRAISTDYEVYFYFQRPGSLIYQKDFVFKDIQCKTEQLFQYTTNMPTLPKKIKHLVIKHLYRKIVFLIGRAYKTSKEAEFLNQCKYYKKQTRKRYWMDLHINPIEKIFINFLHNNPRIIRYLLIKTKNF